MFPNVIIWLIKADNDVSLLTDPTARSLNVFLRYFLCSRHLLSLFRAREMLWAMFSKILNLAVSSIWGLLIH